MNDSPRGVPKPAVRLGDAIRRYLARAGLTRRLDQASVVPEWPELVGPRIAQVATPESVTSEGILFVRVTSAAWMQELQLMSPAILAQLGQRGKKIRRIIWKIG